MKHLFLLAIPFLLAAQGSSLQAQDHGAPIQEIPPFGFDPRSWESVQDRWIRSQPVVVVYRNDSGITGGQPIRFTDMEMLIYPQTGIPTGKEWQEHIVSILAGEVDSIAFQRGGNRILRAKRSSVYYFPEANQDGKIRPKLESGSIYQDSLVPDVELPEAFLYSKVLRQVYPQKHFRLSIGIGMGPDAVTNDIIKKLESAPLGDPYDHFGHPVSFELIDLSFRFAGRFLAGWQFIPTREYSYLYAYQTVGTLDYNYSYSVSFSEHRFYGEVALFPVDRYFLHRFELLAGAGFLLARPRTSLYYSYYMFEEPDTYFEDYLFTESETTLPGFQLRTAFHYYLFPGLSLFTGLEMNLYRHWNVSEMELPSPPDGQMIVFPAQELVFNTLRFRIGIGIYL